MNSKNNFLKKSLKPIKKDIEEKNRLFMTIRHLYNHLSGLSNQEILEYYNVKSLKELHAHIEHIKEVLKKRLDNYEKKLDEIDACFCIDSRGDFKYLYSNKKEAQKQIDYIWQTKRIKLSHYLCPYNCGWHLTKLK